MEKETLKSLKEKISILENRIKEKEEEITNFLQPIINALVESDELVEKIRDEVVSNLSIS